MIVYLIRHGETNYNKNKRLQGQTDIELNEYGRQLAQITGEALKDIKFDCAISSPLKRAKETAKLIIGCNETPMVIDDRIMEIGFGEYEGKCIAGPDKNLPESFQNFFQAPERYEVPPQGESFEHIMKRTGEFWQDLVSNQERQDQTILVSTHGCALKAILANIRNTPLKGLWGTGVHKNCAVTIVKVTDGTIEVVEDGKIYY